MTKLALAGRVVDERQIERHFKSADLNDLYVFDPIRHLLRSTPLVPKDRLLAELTLQRKDLVMAFHEHDSLLENKSEEELSESERKAAWDEFENEKRGVTNMAMMQDSSAFGNRPDLQEIYDNFPEATLCGIPLILIASKIYNSDPSMTKDEFLGRLRLTVIDFILFKNYFSGFLIMILLYISQVHQVRSFQAQQAAAAITCSLPTAAGNARQPTVVLNPQQSLRELLASREGTAATGSSANSSIDQLQSFQAQQSASSTASSTAASTASSTASSTALFDRFVTPHVTRATRDPSGPFTAYVGNLDKKTDIYDLEEVFGGSIRVCRLIFYSKKHLIFIF